MAYTHIHITATCANPTSCHTVNTRYTLYCASGQVDMQTNRPLTPTTAAQTQPSPCTGDNTYSLLCLNLFRRCVQPDVQQVCIHAGPCL